ncbi:HSPB1-associated protein 1 homolog [Trematomus bernacchii]|uniref:HSPB1-associated protein 1 homolog n=1 Tax=Trematomus bernacchii TaxID=40690 RepID=UPI00146B4AD7|nr:HSPB1-associated protein 1 homolog [Trematomus bernacchii]
MAAPEVKSFSPEEAQRIIFHLQQPAVFTNMSDGWPALRWTAEKLSDCLHKLIRFRLGRKEETNTPLFETQCSYVEATLEHFLLWTQGQKEGDVGPFCEYPKSEYWAYADYKYIALLFQDQPAMFEDVKWSQFGFEGRNGRESTLWIGSEGANTPCHLDSYGCNLVLQVQGRKRWHLFPPEDTPHLYPTRIPFEESSVFSQLDVLHPDLRRFPGFHGARAHIVTLQPGQVLYVPQHWWHYVESLDPITVSVNSWIEMEEDDVARVGEAVTKAVVCAFKRDENPEDWLNPTEEGVASHDENMQCVNLAVRACAQRQRGSCHRNLTRDPGDSRTLKRDSTGQVRKNSNLFTDSAPFSIPFGPHLIPVCCQQETKKDLEVKPSTNCDVKSQEACTVSSDAAQRTSAVRLQQDKYECSDQCTARDGAVLTSKISVEDYEEPMHSTISTNDLLDCLLHPDIITRVTELLLERHTGSRSAMARS